VQGPATTLLVAKRGNNWQPLPDPAAKCVIADGRSAFASIGLARTLIGIARAIAATDQTVREDLILACLPKNQLELAFGGETWVLEEAAVPF